MTKDEELRAAILDDCDDPRRLVQRVMDYYHDLDRSNRTSRSQMYLDIGMLCGTIMKLLDLAAIRARVDELRDQFPAKKKGAAKRPPS